MARRLFKSAFMAAAVAALPVIEEEDLSAQAEAREIFDRQAEEHPIPKYP